MPRNGRAPRPTPEFLSYVAGMFAQAGIAARSLAPEEDGKRQLVTRYRQRILFLKEGFNFGEIKESRGRKVGKYNYGWILTPEQELKVFQLIEPFMLDDVSQLHTKKAISKLINAKHGVVAAPRRRTRSR